MPEGLAVALYLFGFVSIVNILIFKFKSIG